MKLKLPEFVLLNKKTTHALFIGYIGVAVAHVMGTATPADVITAAWACWLGICGRHAIFKSK